MTSSNDPHLDADSNSRATHASTVGEFGPTNEKVEYTLDDLAGIAVGTVRYTQQSRKTGTHRYTRVDQRDSDLLRRLVRHKH